MILTLKAFTTDCLTQVTMTGNWHYPQGLYNISITKARHEFVCMYSCYWNLGSSRRNLWIALNRIHGNTKDLESSMCDIFSDRYHLVVSSHKSQRRITVSTPQDSKPALSTDGSISCFRTNVRHRFWTVKYGAGEYD